MATESDLRRVVKVEIDASAAQSGGKQVEQAMDSMGRKSLEASKQVKELDKSQSLLEKTSRSLKQAIGALTAGFTGYQIIRAVLRDNIAFEQGLAGVAKTASLSATDLDRYTASVLNLSTELPIATRELLDISQSIARFGVSDVGEITKFTETVAKLGTATNLQGDFAATSLARLLNVTGEAIDSVDVLGSVFVRLGNNVAASEREIARWATFVAQAVAIYDVSSTDASAIGATFAELGVRAELAGSAIGRSFRAIDRAVRGGAGGEIVQLLTGLGQADLEKQFDEDAVGVFLRFAEGLQSVKQQGGDVVKVLAQLNLRGEDVLRSVPTIANNYQRLARNLQLARDEVQANTALNNEFNRANATLGSSLKRLENAFFALRVSVREMNGPLADVTDLAGEVAIEIANIRDETQPASATVKLLADAVVLLTAAGSLLVGIALARWILGLLGVTQVTTAAMLALNKAYAAFIAANYIAHPAILATTLAFASLGAVVGGLAIGYALQSEFESIQKWADDVVAAFDQLAIDIKFTSRRGLSGLLDDTTAGASNVFADLVEGLSNTAIFQQAGHSTVANQMREYAQTLRTVSKANLDTARQDADQLDDEYQRAKQALAERILLRDQEREAEFAARRAAGDTGSLGSAFETMLAPVRALREQLFGLTQEQAKAGDGADNLTNKYDEMLNAANQAGVSLDELSLLMADNSAEAKELARNIKPIVDMIAALRVERGLVFLPGDQRERAQELAKLRSDLDGLTDQELEAVAVKLRTMPSIWEVLAPPTDPARAALTREILLSVEEDLKKLEEAERLRGTFEDIGSAASDAFTNIVTGAESASDALEGFLNQLIKIGAQQFIGGFVSNQLSGLFGLIPGVGAPSAIPNVIPEPSAVGNILSKGRVVPFANGGILDRPTFMPLAGESGPEAVLPLQRDSQGRLGVTGANGGASIRMTVVTADADSFARNRRQVMRQLRKGLGR